MERAHAPIEYLYSLLGSIRKESFGLHRMQRLMAELGHPERAAGIVHLAGTNGKGSTAAMIESGLRAAGHSTGLYTSPHLSRLNERFLLDGQAVSDDALAAAIEPVRRASERIVARHGRGLHPTFFRIGLGGRPDPFRAGGIGIQDRGDRPRREGWTPAMSFVPNSRS